MGLRRRSRARRTIGGYRRPLRKDNFVWLAVGLTVAGVVVQSPFDGWPSDTSGWVTLGAQVLLTALFAFVVVGILAATVRGFGEGWRTAEAEAPPRPPRRTRRRATSDPTPQPEPQPAAAAPVEADAAPVQPEPAPVEPQPVPVEPEAATQAATATAPQADAEPQPDAEREAEPEPEAEKPPPTRAAPSGASVERTVRAFGRAVGAARRTYRDYDKPS